jgi:hypothetical protein
VGFIETMNALNPNTKWIISDDGVNSVFHTSLGVNRVFDSSEEGEKFLNDFLSAYDGFERDDYEVICA